MILIYPAGNLHIIIQERIQEFSLGGAQTLFKKKSGGA